MTSVLCRCRVSCYFLNNMVEQLFTECLHWIWHSRSSEHELKFSEGAGVVSVGSLCLGDWCLSLGAGLDP
jgi:hypothetical protein